MAVIYQLPVAFDQNKSDSIIKHYKDTVAKENVPYTVRKKQIGGSPSALKHMEAQRKRRQLIAKKKEKRLQRKKIKRAI